MKMSEVDERSGGIYAVNSVMEARSDIVHNGLTVKDVEIIKAHAAFALCFEDVAGRLSNLVASLHQPVVKVLGDV